MKAKELKTKKDEELVKLLKSKRQELRKIRFGSAGSQAKDVSRIGTVRRDVAKILTELNRRTA